MLFGDPTRGPADELVNLERNIRQALDDVFQDPDYQPPHSTVRNPLECITTQILCGVIEIAGWHRANEVCRNLPVSTRTKALYDIHERLSAYATRRIEEIFPYNASKG